MIAAFQCGPKRFYPIRVRHVFHVLGHGVIDCFVIVTFHVLVGSELVRVDCRAFLNAVPDETLKGSLRRIRDKLRGDPASLPVPRAESRPSLRLAHVRS